MNFYDGFGAGVVSTFISLAVLRFKFKIRTFITKEFSENIHFRKLFKISRTW